jgi:oxalate decarboxylase
MAHPNVFHLEQSNPKTYPGGVIRGASRNEFPIVTGRCASMYSARLPEGGVREPHWHPNAWEFSYCLAGRARMTVLDPRGHVDTFEVEPGDAVFVPQGHYHYFENIGAGELRLLLVFNADLAEADDDIGVVASVGVLPDDVLAAMLGISRETAQSVPRHVEPVVLGLKSPER